MKKILEITFIEDFGTHAYICEGGDIRIQIMVGKMFTKAEFLNEFVATHHTDFIEARVKLFDDLHKRYLQLTKRKSFKQRLAEKMARNPESYYSNMEGC